MTEAELTSAVLELLDVLGWIAVHTRAARTAHGWRTPLQGPSSRGWPDIAAVKGNRFLVAELKVGKNRATPEQMHWLVALAGSGAEAFIWTEHDWTAGEIERVLRRREPGRRHAEVELVS